MVALGMRPGGEDGAGRRGQRHEMRQAVFGPVGRKVDRVASNFRPAQPADFLTCPVKINSRTMSP
jgi:hypothetical protein